MLATLLWATFSPAAEVDVMDLNSWAFQVSLSEGLVA